MRRPGPASRRPQVLAAEGDEIELAPLSTSSMPISTPRALRLVAMQIAPAHEQHRAHGQVMRNGDGLGDQVHQMLIGK